ncbi:hypothetical protein N8T08_011044 [Aspergillus melleus]|uniref:Uncharacterized protein n=1 Tax=Aspergillus melleus TaxID=138277 RepID=A0ACC3AQI7_9EURO|nr:hypothetical protein N8T08_011044 [Aspergillus melleus]
MGVMSILLRFVSGFRRPKYRLHPEPGNGDNDPRGSEIVLSLPYAAAHLVACIAACVLSWVELQDDGASWKRALLLSYLVVLGVARIACRKKNRDARAQLYVHVNVIALATLALGVVQDAVPMVIVGATYRPRPIAAALLGCLAAVVVIALATPRPRRSSPSFLPDSETGTGEQLWTDDERSPEETCSLFSYYCSYEWITYVILRGCRKDLTMDDLPPLPSYDEPSRWLKKIKKQRLKGGKTFRTLCRLLKTEIKTMMCWSATTAVVEFVAPYAMLRLLAYFEDDESAVVHPAVWISLLFVGPVMRSLCYQQYIFTATRLLVRVNVSLVQEIYQTAMRSYIYDDSVGVSSSSSRKAADTSKGASKSSQANLTTLMSYDVDAIYNSRDIFHVSTSAPISITFALVFLYRIIGWPSLLGVLTMLILTPLPALASRKVSKIQRSVMQATDVRLFKISEYLNSIRTLKYFGWENAAIDSINGVRGVEQRRLWRRSVFAAAISMAGDLLPMMSLLVMFSTVVLFTDLPLRAPIAFTSLSIMETLRSQFVWLSNVSRYTAQGAESLRRVDRFFDTAGEIKRHPDGPLELNQATFKRTPIAAFKLQDVSVHFKPRALNVVTGPTGSGKTSLLLSLLGETVLESGTASCPRDVAYVPQAPWLQNDTVRQNIVFYSAFDEVRYNIVVEASGLVQDLRQLPAGDLTVVGERGTSLSGGQKQRVSLARALYSRSSTLLLDDIFSALDTHTTTLVFDKCFRSGLLSDRTVVLVTRYPAALQDAQLTVRLEHGKVVSVKSPTSVQPSLLPTPCSTPTLGTGTSTPLNEPQRVETEDIPSEPMTNIAPVVVQDPPSVTQDRRLAKETTATGRVPRTMLYQYGSWVAAKKMHQRLVTAVLSAPITWFDENPIGRAINRFGNDTRSMDTVLIDWLRMSIENGLRFLLRIASVASIMPIFALPAAVICTAGFVIGEMYTRAQVSIKRLVSINYSPVFSHFTDSLAGLSVIRAREGMDEVFQRLLAERLAVHARSAETQYNCNRWVSVRSDFCAASVAAAAGCVAYFWSGSAGLVGFSLTNAIGLSQTILTLVRSMNELEVELNSFQRMGEYAAIEPEENLTDKQALAHSVPASWPVSGRVEFHDVTARYHRNGPDVLRNVSFVANPGERIGIVGRTGSGKSTLGLSLLRFVDLAQGKITIDGVDISSILLNRLRTSVTLIPQEPVLFSGDVHSNLDPFGDSSDTELQSALAACTSIHVPETTHNDDDNDNDHPSNPTSPNKPTTTTSRPLTLSTLVAANGENFSQGQRQVLSLARAMCRRSKVVLLDEATASVDHETDMHMQRVLRAMFPDCTIIAIAHRLRTIMDYDRVLVMSEGEIVENDSPTELVKQQGIFWDMLRNTGEYEDLIHMIDSASG